MTIGGFEIEKKFSLGHIVTIVTMIIGLTVGWQALAGQTAGNTAEITAVKAENRQQDEALASMLAIINAERLEQQKLLTEMRVDIRYLRRAVENEKREAAVDE